MFKKKKLNIVKVVGPYESYDFCDYSKLHLNFYNHSEEKGKTYKIIVEEQ